LDNYSTEKWDTEKELAFYEQFPYPLNHSHGRTFRDYLCRLLGEIFKGRDEPVKVLDAGCGTGAVTRLLAELLPRARIVGVDQSYRSIELAENAHLQNVEFYHKDLCNGLAWDKQFDFVFCHGVLHHIDRMKAALETLIRSLTSDGVLYIWLYSRHGRTEIDLVRQIETKLLTANQKDVRTRIELLRTIRSYFPTLSYIENKIVVEQSGGDEVDLNEETRFIIDRYLPPIARHFNVTEATELFTSCGLRVESIPQFDWMEIDKDLSRLKQVRREDVLKYYAICEMLNRPSGIGYVLRI